MKLLSVFFLLFLISLATAHEFKPCGSHTDCSRGLACINSECRIIHRKFNTVPDFSVCRTHSDCFNGESCVVGKCQYECNPKCADGLACLQGICVDGN